MSDNTYDPAIDDSISEVVNTRNVVAIRDYTVKTRELFRELEKEVTRLQGLVVTLTGLQDAYSAQVAALWATLLGGGPTEGVGLGGLPDGHLD